MALIKLVVAVRRNEAGDVESVRWGTVDTDIGQGKWLDGNPVEAPVIDVVDRIMAGDDVRTRLSNGTPGPKLKVILAKAGRGIETIALIDDRRTFDDLEKL